MTQFTQSLDATSIRLLLVDDHQVVRIGLRTLFESTPGISVVGEADSSDQALAEVIRLKPDVVLLDIRLPTSGGLEVCRRIQELPGEVRVLILTSYSEDQTVYDAIAAGADGYLLKEVESERLVEAVRIVAAGKSVFDSTITNQVLLRVRAGSASGPDNKMSKLSAQEQRVLALVAQGKTNREIAADMGLSERTVKNYFSNVLHKLALSRRTQAAALFLEQSARQKPPY
jgi:two-component system, NarL family, response regulator DevR